MNKETKSEVKKNVATGASTAAGAAAGVAIGAAITPDNVEAAEAVTPEPVDQSEPRPQLQHENTTQEYVKPAPVDPAPVGPNPVKPAPVHPDPVNPDPVGPTPGPEPEVEVVGYERVTNPDGSQMDVAVLDVNGNELAVIDANIDGMADVMAADLDGNGVIDANEMQDISGQSLSMQPLQEAAGFTPEYAQNDLPDYVNDADVDNYMA